MKTKEEIKLMLRKTKSKLPGAIATQRNRENYSNMAPMIRLTALNCMRLTNHRYSEVNIIGEIYIEELK